VSVSIINRALSYATRFEGTSYADYYDYDSTNVRGREEALQRYEDLKENLRRRSQRFGVGLATYLFLTVSGEVRAEYPYLMFCD
jgi:hypothetical protein